MKTKFTTVMFSAHLTDSGWTCYTKNAEDFLGTVEWDEDKREYILTNIKFTSAPFSVKRLQEIAQFMRQLAAQDVKDAKAKAKA